MSSSIRQTISPHLFINHSAEAGCSSLPSILIQFDCSSGFRRCSMQGVSTSLWHSLRLPNSRLIFMFWRHQVTLAGGVSNVSSWGITWFYPVTPFLRNHWSDRFFHREVALLLAVSENSFYPFLTPPILSISVMALKLIGHEKMLNLRHPKNHVSPPFLS